MFIVKVIVGAILIGVALMAFLGFLCWTFEPPNSGSGDEEG